MNEILLNICITAVLVSVFKTLIPDERKAKPIRLLLSCFFIIVVFNSVKGNMHLDLLGDLPEINTDYNDYSVEFSRQTAEEAANELREKIRETLCNEGIVPEKIYIDINISENSSISFNEIRLVFDDISAESAERAVSITRKIVENEIEVSLEEI